MTRLELYERVCARPLSKVAPELGISGTALAAICKRHQIPYPGSGYWTRKSFGFPVQLPALPEAPNEIFEIVPSVAQPRTRRTGAVSPARKPRSDVKSRQPARHPLLAGVEEHYRKSRRVDNEEFLRPYKRILPDMVSSEPALSRALSIANDLYLALGEQGYGVEIAQPEDNLQRIPIGEQEVERKDRRYGRYHTGGIWAPDRPTVVHVGTVPIALALTEMTQRVTMRYFDGSFHREDSKLIRSAKPWQLTNSWTTEQDVPCGRFRLVAYSPKRGVDWFLSWQDTEQQSLGMLMPQIVEALSVSKDKLQRHMDAADAEAERLRKEWQEQCERREWREDARKTAQAISDSRQQLAQIIETWGKAVTVERFFADATERLKTKDSERRPHLEERLTLAMAMIGGIDPLDYIEGWIAPQERHQSRYAQNSSVSCEDAQGRQ